jgi:hypothetical protein
MGVVELISSATIATDFRRRRNKQILNKGFDGDESYIPATADDRTSGCRAMVDT